jgi:hypothetical protein
MRKIRNQDPTAERVVALEPDALSSRSWLVYDCRIVHTKIHLVTVDDARETGGLGRWGGDILDEALGWIGVLFYMS